jgi:hypothetical protein
MMGTHWFNLSNECQHYNRGSQKWAATLWRALIAWYVHFMKVHPSAAHPQAPAKSVNSSNESLPHRLLVDLAVTSSNVSYLSLPRFRYIIMIASYHYMSLLSNSFLSQQQLFGSISRPGRYLYLDNDTLHAYE